VIDLPVMPDKYRPGRTKGFSKTLGSSAPDCEKHAGKGVSTDPDDLLPKATIDDIKAALAVIPANCGEEVWWRICAALYDHFGGSEEGFKIFHEWSATGGASYKGERDCRNKWEHSAKKTGIHIATLFHYAKQYDASWRKAEPEPEAEAEAEEPPTDPKDECRSLTRRPIAALQERSSEPSSLTARATRCQRESTRHYPNLFAAIVGNTALARKGTALGRVLDVMYHADSGWKSKRQQRPLL
jgi:Primase C terminal 2 (PriCT-2)